MSKISGITTVCFDIDGTLVKHSASQQDDVLRTLGYEPSAEFREQVECFWNNLPKKLQNGKVVEKEKVYRLAESMIPYLRKIRVSGKEWYLLSEKVDKIELIDGAYEILEYLQEQGYYIVASTNTFASYQTNVLKDLKILSFFDRIYGWDTICAKPHRKAIFSLVSMHSTESIIFVGDNVYTDISMANKIGIKSIGYNLQYGDRESYIKPTVHISDLLEIKKHL